MDGYSTQHGPLRVHDDRHIRKMRTFEVFVFLFLIVPSMAISLFVIGQVNVRFTLTAISSILNDLALVLLILYFIRINGERLRDIGWTADRAGREIVLGIVLFLPVFLFTNLLDQVLSNAGFSAPAKMPSFLQATGIPKIILATVLVTVVAIAEETIFRGYLLLRFVGIMGHTLPAVLLSSLVFSLGHGYEGTAGMISIFTLGAIFSAVYLWRRSLIAPMVMHFLIDFSSIVLVAIMETG